MTKAIVVSFNHPLLNEIGSQLIENYQSYNEHQMSARNLLKKAIVRRFLSGKLISTNIDIILEECGSQRAFGEKIGISDGMLSNDKRAYEALAERGITEPEDMLEHLKQKQIKPNIFEWERLPTFLEDPDAYRDRRSRDEKRLETAHSIIEDVKIRNEGANPELAERAGDTLKYLKDVESHIDAQDVFKSGWRSRQYLDFVKSIGWDYITGDQSSFLDPHHTLIGGGSRGPKGKVSDVFTIPVTRDTHEKIESGQLKLSTIQIAEALIRTMALFITTNMKSDE